MPAKKKQSKFSGLKKKAKALKREGVSKDERRLAIYRKQLERFVEKEHISGVTKDRLMELADPSPEVRFRAITSFMTLEDKRVYPVLVGALNDSSAKVRARATFLIGDSGDRLAVNPFIEALKDVDSGVRWRAAMYLGVYEDKRAVLPLISALRDKDGLVRRMAATSLGKLEDKRAVSDLISALKDTEVQVARAVTEALGRLGDKRAISPLLSALDNLELRENTLFALNRLSLTLVSGNNFKRLTAAGKMFHGLTLEEQTLLALYLASNHRQLERYPVELSRDRRAREFITHLRAGIKDRPTEEIIKILKLDKLAKKKGNKK